MNGPGNMPQVQRAIQEKLEAKQRQIEVVLQDHMAHDITKIGIEEQNDKRDFA